MAGQISESDQIKQFKEFLGTYNKITENCFLDCIKDFTSREVKTEETWDPKPENAHWRRIKHDLLRPLLTEVFKNDTTDLHEISGVPHSAERSSGS